MAVPETAEGAGSGGSRTGGRRERRGFVTEEGHVTIGDNVYGDALKVAMDTQLPQLNWHTAIDWPRCIVTSTWP